MGEDQEVNVANEASNRNLNDDIVQINTDSIPKQPKGKQKQQQLLTNSSVAVSSFCLIKVQTNQYGLPAQTFDFNPPVKPKKHAGVVKGPSGGFVT